jgi:hypothetical protein
VSDGLLSRRDRSDTHQSDDAPADADGTVHVSYDKFVPIMAPLGIPDLDKVTRAIDGVLEKLATAAIAAESPK